MSQLMVDALAAQLRRWCPDGQVSVQCARRDRFYLVTIVLRRNAMCWRLRGQQLEITTDGVLCQLTRCELADPQLLPRLKWATQLWAKQARGD